ncbi:helix-turn-helix domain-containing protein [Desulfovibrio inopinatus]|uniref:helix-turn-helix domain-containing protein n=1 Tax=Desulfovibrio inopinatus TaxID=102109 RepID=UPI0003FC8CB0|nr:helix-turn-helix transcriptional regulator [Desulfovibrio inopinatus]
MAQDIVFNLRQKLNQCNIEQCDLANAIGVSKSQISHIFAGRRRLSGRIRQRFETAYASLTVYGSLNFTPDYFTNNDEKS